MTSDTKWTCVGLAAGTLLTRFATRSHALYDLDSVNYAFALDHFDPVAHQPQPPGYFLYVLLGRVVRLWTQEHAPFWTRHGFQSAGATALEKLPSVWDRSAADWLVFQIRDEETIASVEKEFAMFMASEKQRTAQALAQAKRLKAIVTVIALILTAAVLIAAGYIYFKRRSVGSLP